MKKQLCVFIFLLSVSPFVFGYNGGSGEENDSGDTCAPKSEVIQHKQVGIKTRS